MVYTNGVKDNTLQKNLDYMFVLTGGRLELNIFLKLGLLLSFALAGARVARKFGLPNVTGYLIGGLFLGPSFLNIMEASDSGMINFINEFALSAIAFNVGGEFLLRDLKRLGKEIFIITVAEVVGVILLVFGVMFFIFNQEFAFSLIVASMSAATAPAGTLMVIQQYRAKGPLTDTILPITALDDALGIMAFGIALSVSKLVIGGADASLMMFLSPVIEIILSLALGFGIGFLFSRVSTKASSQEELLSIALFFIIINTGVANYLNLSPLLSGMMMGAVHINIHPNPSRLFSTVNSFTPPIHLMFFAFAGASLDLSVLSQIGLLGTGYVASRFFGKVLGASAGAKLAGSDPKIVKYIGLALLPQGGISIGLSMVVARELPSISTNVITLILFSVLVFEIMGPILAKYAITKAGETNV